MLFAFYSLQAQSSQRNKLFCRLLKNWNITDSQCCANLCCIAKWSSYTPIDTLYFYILFHCGLSRAIEYSSTLYVWTLLIISSKCINNSLYLPTPKSQSIPLPPPISPLANTSLESMSMSLFLFCRQVYLCHILDSICKWCYMVFVFLTDFLTYLVW